MNYYFVSFLFSLFLTSIGQPITYDPNNPYCAQFSGSICQSCGLSNSNTYALYDQICTPVVTSDEVLNGQIISRAPPHCSDYDGEYCQSCDNILDKSFYKDDGSSRFLFCVAECGYSSFGDDGSGECKSCPASCAVCKDKNTCLQCDYDLTRWQAQISSTNEGILNCSQHSERVNITSDDPNYTKIFYITPADRSCKSLGTCDGSLDNPYDDINLVLKNLIEETKIGQFFKMSIAIYLLKDNTNTDHFWLEDQALPVYYSRLFEGTMIDALIQPAVCEDLTKCFTDTEKATIYLKSNTISLFTAWKLNIKNIIFDASELIPDGTCYTTNKYTTNRCCNSSGDLPSRSNPTSDAICSLITPLNSLLVLPDLAYDPSVDIWPQGPYSFITLQPILDASDYEVPELLIESCEFKHFWYHRYARSLISLSHSGSKVTIKDTIFTNFYFRDGLITNAHSAIQRKTLFTSDVTPKFNCSGNSSDSCFSIWIEGSMFNYSLFDNTTYGRQSSIQNMSVQDNEGIILFLVSFDGPITLINNTFEKIASVQVSIAQPLSCQNASRIGSVSNHSLDRKIQFELGSEYLQNVRSSSLINIRNLVKGIIIYKNTFRNNIALTGTNFLIHNFDNTKDFPIIIEKNTFDTNLALAFGSSFALINYERDYVTMDCEGVYIYENLFTDNIGCPSAAGNAMVVCIPEKSSLSPFLQTAASSSSSISSTSWVSYYPSVNQNGMDSLGVRQSYTDDIDSLTQSSFVTFLQFITQNKDETHTVTHPITQDLIDTSRVIISSNTFLRNHISTAQLFAQGAHNIQLTSNTLQENTFVLPSLAQSVPIFGKIFGNIIYNLTAISSPMIVRLANYINIEQNFFINNFQHDSVGTGITVGSAISIDRHIGYVPVIIYNNTFTNYSGAVLQDSLANTLASNTTTTIPPLVTYSIWEKMQGLSCAGTQLSAFSDPNNAVIQVLESKFEYNIKYDKNITASGRLLSPNNKGSVWFFTDSDRAAGSAAFSIVSEFFGVSLLVQVTGCQVTSKTSLYLQGSTFLSNVNQVETSLFNLVGFDTSYINGNQFTNNTLSSTKTGEEASFIYFVQTAADKDSWAEISGNVFEFNTGRLLNINQSLAAANITTVFRDNVITNHTAQSELIHLASATNVGFYNMSIFNLTAVVGLLNIEGSSATITIQDVNVDGIKTFQKGCFYISSIDQGFALSNFACANSELHVTQNITLKNQIAFVACFTFYNQHSDSVEFDNLVCQNASIVYDITTPITTEITLASCFVLNKITDMTLQNFTCSGTSIKNTNLAHPLSYLGQVTKTTYFTLTDSTFHGNVVEKSILITKCKLNWNNLTISNNSATADATFLLVQNSRNVYFQNLKFLGNKCLNCVGGFIFFNSIANVENSVFSENQALEAPTFNAMLGQLTITGCTFYRNVALDLSSAISAEDAYLILLDSTFEENRSKGNLITFLQNWCEINYCNFIRNEAELGSKNIYANSGHLYIAFSTFIGSGGSEANTVEGDFIAVYNNDLAVEYTSFQNGTAQTGGAIAIEDFQSVASFFHITSCDFIGNSAANNGGAIYAVTGAERRIYITDSRFYNNTAFGQGGAIYAEKISSVIAYTSFTTNGSTILYLSEGTHDLENLDFTGYRQTSFAQAIYANQIDTMYLYYTNVNGFGYNDIEDSDLDPQDSPLSAFVLIASPTVQSSFYFLFNSFQNNQGLQGGAIYAQGNIMMLMLSVSFSNNKAIDGGAIYYASTSSEAVFEFSDMVKFNSNQALNSGGALKYTNKTFKFSASDTEFRDNVAIYGNNISAYGTFIVPAFYNSLDMTGTSRILENSTTFIMNSIYSSGDFIDPPFRFQIRDDLDQDVIIDNSSTVEVSLSYITNTTTPLSFSGQIPFTAVNGYVTLDSLKIHGAPGSTVQMQTRLKTLNGSSNPVSVIIQLRECMLGEMLTEDQTCYLCPNVKYTLTIGELNSCQMCPENGLCYGSNIFGPQKNFWRYSDLDNKLNECYNDEACLGAVLEDTSIMSTSYCAPGMLVNNSFCLTGWCREGYHGRMCSECGEGWAQSNAGLKSCSRCSGSFKSIGIIILLVLGGGLYVLFVIWNALNEEKKEAYYTEYSVVDPSSVQNTPEKEKLTVATFQNVGDKSGIMNTGPQESDRKLVPSMSSSTEPKFNRRNSLRLSISLSNVPLTRQNLKRHSIDMLNETPSSKSNLSPPKLPKSSRMFRMSSIYFASEIKEKEVKSPNNQANEIKILNSPTNSQEKLVNKSTPKSITIKTSKSLNKLNKASVYTKILTNYIQLASIINITDFGWPDTVKKIFAIQTALAQTSSEVFSFDCILKNSFFAKFGFSSFFAKLLIVSISPVAIIILITLIWIVIYLIKYRKSLKSIPRSLCSNIIMSIVITLFILHPTIVEFSAAAFQCATLGDDASSSTYLLGDLQLECYSPEHMKIALPIALPSLIIWGFGIPFFAWLVVFLHRNTLETYSTRARYGFLYEGCQTKFYYWEFVVFYRKVILIVISTFLVEYSVDLQAILVLGVSAGFYLLQVKIAPYETSTLNEMEKRSLIFSTLTIYCGLFCLTKQLSSSDKVVPFLVLIFANLYFLIYWVIEFLKAKSAQLLENKYCAKYCGKILTKLAAFEWKRRNAAIKDEAQHVLATAAAGLLKQDSTPDKTDTEKDNSPETEQVRQNQLDTEKQDKLNDAINLEEDPENPEDPSDITLGESDYKRKPIRDSASLRSLFSRPIPSNSGNLMLKDAVQTIPSGRQSSRHSSGTSSIFQFHNKPTFLNEI